MRNLGLLIIIASCGVVGPGVQAQERTADPLRAIEAVDAAPRVVSSLVAMDPSVISNGAPHSPCGEFVTKMKEASGTEGSRSGPSSAVLWASSGG